MKRIFALLFLSSVLVLSACNSDDKEMDHSEHEENDTDELRTLDVDLDVPETTTTGEKVEFTAHVTSNDEDVDDADSVMFEVLQGDDSIDMIDGEHDEDGKYTIEYTFDEAGEYNVISHVDAFDLHTMPEETVTVE